MPLRFPVTQAVALVTGISLLFPVTSALAADGPTSGWRNGSWYGADDTLPSRPPAPVDERPTAQDASRRPYARYDRDDGGRPDHARPDYDPAGREAWLADCRNRVSERDNGVGGAVIGGVVGGVAGNRIAGRHNRTVGTLAGAAVGAVAGSAIDRAEDRGRAHDECEAYLDDYYAHYAQSYAPAYGRPGYQEAYAPGYAYAGGGNCCSGTRMIMVPVSVQSEPECTETVEYIYEDVPARSHQRTVKRTKIMRDKRVKIAPDKRIITK